MCECGCGEGMNPTLTFPGPDGITYAIALYAGCRDCSNPAGLMLYEIPTAELEKFNSDWGPPDTRKPLRWFKSPMPGVRECPIPTILIDVKNFEKKARLAFDDFEKLQAQVGSTKQETT
jgi:hypothetical protein